MEPTIGHKSQVNRGESTSRVFTGQKTRILLGSIMGILTGNKLGQLTGPRKAV